MKSVVLLAVCGVFLTGCTNPYRAPQPQLVAEANSVDLMLAEAADRATRALETLSAMESTQMPVKPIATVARAPQELQRAVTFEWSGPAEPLVEELARKSGYSYGVIDAYVQNGEVPKQETLSETAGLFDVLLSFADSVAPRDDKAVRHHAVAHVMGAAGSVAAAIQKEDFGFERPPLFETVMEGLRERAVILGEALNVTAIYEDGILESVAGVFAACYDATAARKAAGDDIDGQEALAAVWSACDERLMLIQGLTGFVGENIGMPKKARPKPQAKPSARSEKPKAPPAPVAADAKAAKSAKDDRPGKDAGDDNADDENENKDKDRDDDDGDFNPMAFFAGGKG